VRLQVSWFRVLAEGVVIGVSILSAFGIQAWWDGRVERKNELAILTELHTALSADLEVLERGLDRFRTMETRGAVLMSYLRSGAPYADSLDAYFGTVYSFSHPQLNRGGYESLKSQGIGVVSDAALRSQIAQVYEQTLASVEASMNLEESVVLDVLRPYFLAHFRDLRSGQSATPLDFAAVSRDVQFLNALDYRLQGVARRDILRFERAVSEMNALIDAIEIELSR